VLHLLFKMTMKPYWVKTHRFIKKLFSRYVWDIPNNNKTVYLTFDDGPTPEVTEWVLDVLKQYEVQGTFFCIGNNINNNPAIFRKVIEGGHTVANHTYNHLNGWKNDNKTYFDNIEATEKAIEANGGKEVFKKLFRPPYGKIKGSQAAEVRRLGYRIIMWDVLSADFDRTITPEQCLQNVIKNTREGSVIIFHDSVKAFPNVEYALPRAIEYLKEKGFKFEAIA
jgi:peptidoglycan/xylan/chitin deacetylase (PgdA/CDA1 family)